MIEIENVPDVVNALTELLKMPEHIRHKLICDLRKVSDSAYEFIQFEQLNSDEKAVIENLRESIDEWREKVWSICEDLRKTRPGDKPIFRKSAPKPRKKFSWTEHEVEAKKKKLEKELEQLQMELLSESET